MAKNTGRIWIQSRKNWIRKFKYLRSVVKPNFGTNYFFKACDDKNTKCETLRCIIEDFSAGSELNVSIKYKLLKNHWVRRNTKFTTKLSLTVEPEKFASEIGKVWKSFEKSFFLIVKRYLEDFEPEKVTEHRTKVMRSISTSFQILPEITYPAWIIIASSLIGITLITIMFIICYRIGWFDRRDVSGKEQAKIHFLIFRLRPTYSCLHCAETQAPICRTTENDLWHAAQLQ